MNKGIRLKRLCLILSAFIISGCLNLFSYAASTVPKDGIEMLSAGYMHSVLLKEDGTVWNWGKNYHGQLGDGTNVDRNQPVQVKGIADVMWIDAGGDGRDGFPAHTAAVKKDGTVWCWGDNKYGQLGDGSRKNRNRPVQVPGITNVVKVSAGGGYTVALKKDGTVWCWGSNEFGQLGNGSKTGSSASSSKPVQVSGLKNIVAVSAAYSYVLALDKDGFVWSWGEVIGRNTKQQTVYKTKPFKVPGIANGKDVAAGMAAYVLKQDGTVWSWGDNMYGELGRGYFGWRESNQSPCRVTGLSGIAAISAGSCDGAAVKNDGSVWCWGDNRSGVLGNGCSYDSAEPVKVTDLTGATQVACGRLHSLALKKDGSVWAWGDNWFGQIGDGTESILPDPQQVEGIADLIETSSGLYHTLALKKDGTVWGWGSTEASQLDFQQLWPEAFTYQPIRLYELEHVKSIAAGTEYSIILKEDGTVWSWGQNGSGQLGDGTQEYREAPVKVKGLSNVVQISAAQSDSMALSRDGTVWVWGEKGLQYARSQKRGSSSVPMKVKGLAGVIAIASDNQRAAALKKDGTVWCWEYDYDRDTVAFRQMPGIKDAIAISCGDQHVCILRKGGTVWSLGNNQAGMLGNGTTTASKSPVQVKYLKDVIGIQSCMYYTLAVKKDGTVWYWGSHMYGRKGHGYDEYMKIPCQVNGIKGVKSVDAGGMHSVALKEDGSIWCWGSNSFGQGGQPNTNRLKPVQIPNLNAYSNAAD